MEAIPHNLPLCHPPHRVHQCRSEHDYTKIEEHGARLRSREGTKHEAGHVGERDHCHGEEQEGDPSGHVLQLGDLEGDDGDADD